MFFYVDSVLTLADGVKGPVDFEKSMLTECFHSDELILYLGNSTSGMSRDVVVSQLPLCSFDLPCSHVSVIFVSLNALNFVVSRYKTFPNRQIASSQSHYFSLNYSRVPSLSFQHSSPFPNDQTSCAFACDLFDNESIRPAVGLTLDRGKGRWATGSKRSKAIWKKKISRNRGGEGQRELKLLKRVTRWRRREKSRTSIQSAIYAVVSLATFIFHAPLSISFFAFSLVFNSPFPLHPFPRHPRNHVRSILLGNLPWWPITPTSVAVFPFFFSFPLHIFVISFTTETMRNASSRCAFNNAERDSRAYNWSSHFLINDITPGLWRTISLLIINVAVTAIFNFNAEHFEN